MGAWSAAARAAHRRVGATPRCACSAAKASSRRPTARPSARRYCARRSAAERFGRVRLGVAAAGTGPDMGERLRSGSS
eukprot:7102002-Pyramimonas_sp.AAC.1